MSKDSNIKVSVHYIAAGKPYMAEVAPTETVAQLKASALTAFGLVAQANKTYKLFHQKQELSDPNRTIGQLAGDKHELKIDLEEFITQGK
jgi:hypothetical protein